jgi:NADPH2:quinone reductase
MRAVQLSSLDGPDGIELAEVPLPETDGRALIEVHAAGVCFADLLMTRGRYQFRPEAPFIPGVELAGVVREAPQGAPFREGDRVAASTPFGAWAEYCLAAAPVTWPIPQSMSFEQATALINYQTAYFCLVERGSARAGETVLIHGAAGGVGSATIDVARGLGLKPIAVARGEEKLAVAREQGAERCIEAESDWLAEVRRITSDRGVDIVFDTVGGDRFLDSVRAMAGGGRLLVVGFAGGSIPEVKVNRLLLKNTSIIGAAWGEYVRHDIDMPQRVHRGLMDLWDGGKLHIMVGNVYPLDRAADALREIDSRRAINKIALSVRR